MNVTVQPEETQTTLHNLPGENSVNHKLRVINQS